MPSKELKCTTSIELCLPFVHPSICENLIEIGINNHATHYWKKYESFFLLDTYEYDVDAYYKKSNEQMIDEIAKPKIVAAFCAAEIETLFNNFSLERKSDTYLAKTVIKNVEYTSILNTRSSDAIGSLLFELLLADAIEVDTVNKHLKFVSIHV